MKVVEIMDWRLNRICFVRCPQCGYHCSLKRHRVEPNGDVRPNLECTKCDFSAPVALVGWNQGAMIFS